MTYNQKTANAKLQRIEICDLIVACTSIAQSLEAEGRTANKWNALHDKLEFFFILLLFYHFFHTLQTLFQSIIKAE